jgi:hypothetical protein
MIRCSRCRKEVYQEDICASCERCIDCVAAQGHEDEDEGREHGSRRLRSGGQVIFPLGEE